MENDTYKLQYLPVFYDDLQQAVMYISDHLGSPQAAATLIDDVEKAILDRLPFAESYEQYPSEKHRDYLYYTIYVKNSISEYEIF